MDKIYLGDKLENFKSSEPFLPISKIILNVDGEHIYTAGDDTGRTIEKSCSWASQEMAESILTTLKNVVYKPYDGSGALLDPAAELGDAITLSGHYSVLASIGRDLDRQGAAKIAAPGADELDDEYPYTSTARRELDRVLAKSYSRISKTSEKILLQVANELEGVNAEIELTASSIRQEVNDEVAGINSTIKQTADSLNSSIKSVDGKITTINANINSIYASVSNLKSDISSVEITANKINWLVKSGTSSSNFTMTDRAISLVADNIDLTGYVTFTNLKTAGATTINGGNITTGLVDADYIHLGGTMTIYSGSEPTITTYRGEFGAYMGYATDTSGNLYSTSGVGIRYSEYTGQLNCTSAGIWCGFYNYSGISAYKTGVTIKGSTIKFSGSTVDFSDVSVTGLGSGTATAVFG